MACVSVCDAPTLHGTGRRRWLREAAQASLRLSQSGRAEASGGQAGVTSRVAVLAGGGGRFVYPCHGWPGPGGAAVTLAVTTRNR
jgi:hypothetical protein